MRTASAGVERKNTLSSTNVETLIIPFLSWQLCICDRFPFFSFSPHVVHMWSFSGIHAQLYSYIIYSVKCYKYLGGLEILKTCAKKVYYFLRQFAS